MQFKHLNGLYSEYVIIKYTRPVFRTCEHRARTSRKTRGDSIHLTNLFVIDIAVGRSVLRGPGTVVVVCGTVRVGIVIAAVSVEPVGS